MENTSQKAERRPLKKQYSVAERKEYIRLFQDSQPITKLEFSAQHGIGRKSLARWLLRYSGDAKPDGVPIADTARPRKAASNSGDLCVTIPYSEYHSLLRIKDKYDLICALTQ